VNADVNDGSCTGIVGCMYSTACNYNEDATCAPPGQYTGCNFGPCQEVGCTDPAYCNYDANADTDDGSCYGLVGDCPTTEFILQENNSGELDRFTIKVHVGDTCYYPASGVQVCGPTGGNDNYPCFFSMAFLMASVNTNNSYYSSDIGGPWSSGVEYISKTFSSYQGQGQFSLSNMDFDANMGEVLLQWQVNTDDGLCTVNGAQTIYVGPDGLENTPLISLTPF
jgi:hypothetical protein